MKRDFGEMIGGSFNCWKDNFVWLLKLRKNAIFGLMHIGGTKRDSVRNSFVLFGNSGHFQVDSKITIVKYKIIINIGVGWNTQICCHFAILQLMNDKWFAKWKTRLDSYSHENFKKKEQSGKEQKH